MTIDVSEFNAPQYGVDTTKRVGVMNLVKWQEPAPVAVPAKGADPNQTAKKQEVPAPKAPRKTECWCGRCERCKEDSRRYREQLLRKN